MEEKLGNRFRRFIGPALSGMLFVAAAAGLVRVYMARAKRLDAVKASNSKLATKLQAIKRDCRTFGRPGRTTVSAPRPHTPDGARPDPPGNLP